jgi:WD40 repeat protein
MVRTLVIVAVALVLLLGLGVWTGVIRVPGFDADTVGTTATTTAKADQLGGDLYPTTVPFPPLDQKAGTFKGDPLTLRGHVQIKDKQEVPALVEGQILFIGQAVPEGVIEACGVAPFLAEPFGYNTVTVGDDKIYKFYRRLLPGQIVHSDEIIGMVECSGALVALMEKNFKIQYAVADEQAAKAAADEAESRYKRDQYLSTRGGVSPAELSASLAAAIKFKYDREVKIKAIDLARTELDQAKTLYAKHEIRNKVPYERCVIQNIHKQRGDPVKAQDPVMTVHSLDHLQVETMVGSAYLGRIRPDLTVTATIEPTQEEPPAATFLAAHRGEVTALAITNDADKPRLVSAGTDRIVTVRDPKGSLPIQLPHEDVVRALVCSPVGAPHNLCLSGAGGKITIWNLDRAAISGGDVAKPLHVLEDAHPSASGPEAARITALAFSPDGTYFASGADDGSIAIWDTAKCGAGDSAPLVYRLDPAHGVDQPHADPITTLAFTPQSRLISAANDKTVRIWHLLQKGAVLEGDIAGRDGTVSHLGVRGDGKWFLFESRNTLQFGLIEHPRVVLPALQNPGSPTPFETLAQFSPDGNLILTAGLPEGRLQLWKAPTETTRGYEVRQFVPKDRQAAVTCAAFCPRKSPPYVVTGNTAGEIYVWELPTQAQIDEFRIENVPVRLLSQSVDTNTHQARVAVDVPNPTSKEYPNGRLLPGKSVTVVIGE